MEATRETQDRNYWRQLITSDLAMDGTTQELLAATHYIRPSNGRHNTGTTGGNSLHPTQQWKEQHRNYWRQLITSDLAMDGTTQELLAATHYIRPSNGRHNTGTTGGNSLHPTQQWKEQHRNYWRQLITSDLAMDGTRQELLAATHYIRPSNGRHNTGTTGGNSLHPTQQWKEQHRNYWRQLITSDPAMEGTTQELLAATHYIRPSNGRNNTGTTGGNSLHPTQQWKEQHRNYWRQLITSDPAMDGTTQELLAATHYIRPSNGRHNTGTTGGNSLHPTQQWKEQHRNYWRQLITSDPAMEGTTQELLAATHYIRPSNGRNNTGTTGGNSLHPTQQWKEQHRNYWRQLITSDPAMDGTTQELLAATHYIRPSNGRHNTGTTGGNSLHPTQQWKEQHRNYWRQLITSDPAMEGTTQELLAATHYIRPSNGRNNTGTTGGNSLHPTQQWKEQHRNYWRQLITSDPAMEGTTQELLAATHYIRPSNGRHNTGTTGGNSLHPT